MRDAAATDSRARLQEAFHNFLQGMLQVCPAMDCTVGMACFHYAVGPADTSSSPALPFNLQVTAAADRTTQDEEVNTVIVDVGQVDERVATLWWALAQQTARVARRSTAGGGHSVSEHHPAADEIQSTSSGSSQERNAAAWAAIAATPSRTGHETATLKSIDSLDPVQLDCSDPTVAVSRRTPSLSSSSCSSACNRTMSTTPMSSPRLVREICQKYPSAAAAYASAALPVYQSAYVYETPSDAVCSSGEGVQLLRYVRVSQSSSVDKLSPDTSTSTVPFRGSLRRPNKSEAMSRKFSSDSAAGSPTTTQQQQQEDISTSVDCVRYESHDLGRDVEDDSLDPAICAYAPIVVVVTNYRFLMNTTTRYNDTLVTVRLLTLNNSYRTVFLNFKKKLKKKTLHLLSCLLKLSILSI